MNGPQGTGAVRGVFGAAADNYKHTNLEPPYQVHCLAFRPFPKATLKGFVTIAVWPFVIDDCTLHAKGNKRWLSFPARSYTDAEGNLRWVSWLGIREKSEFWRFQERALKAIDSFRAAAAGKEEGL